MHACLCVHTCTYMCAGHAFAEGLLQNHTQEICARLWCSLMGACQNNLLLGITTTRLKPPLKFYWSTYTLSCIHTHTHTHLGLGIIILWCMCHKSLPGIRLIFASSIQWQHWRRIYGIINYITKDRNRIKFAWPKALTIVDMLCSTATTSLPI